MITNILLTQEKNSLWFVPRYLLFLLFLYSYSLSFILEVFSKELPIGTFFEIYWQQILIVLHLKMSFFHLHIWAIILLDIKIGVAVLFNTFKMVCHFLLPSVVYDEKSSHSNYCTPWGNAFYLWPLPIFFVHLFL